MHEVQSPGSNQVLVGRVLYAASACISLLRMAPEAASMILLLASVRPLACGLPGEMTFARTPKVCCTAAWATDADCDPLSDQTRGYKLLDYPKGSCTQNTLAPKVPV